MKQQSVWFVIVTYEPDEEVLRQVLTVLEGWPVAVVDNNQYQISNIKYQIDKSNIKYIKTDENLGYGGGANMGTREAFKGGAQWCVVINQDIRLTRKGVTQFCAMVQNCDAGIVGPEAGALDPKRWTTILVQEKRRDSRLRGNDKKDWIPGQARDDKSHVDYISGSCMAIHKAVWEKVGGFYEPYFMYYEDADLCVRARHAGFGLKQVEIEGYRHGGIKREKREGWIPGQARDDNRKEYYLARNHLWFVLRQAPLRVKLYELVRLPKTLMEYRRKLL